MSFSQILGQEKAIEILKKLFSGNRFPQGLLFYGPSGVGKRKVALEVAKVLNCQTQIAADKNRVRMHTEANGKNYPRKSASDFEQSAGIRVIDACDTCLPCQKIDKGIHPDVKIISPEPGKDILGIDQIRELNRDSQWKPFEGKYKVYILEKAERLNQEAANSFLKTLEEPPAQVLFILLSENKDTILPTVLSRCWRLPFSGLSEEVIRAILQRAKFNYPKGIVPDEYFFAGRMQEIIFDDNFPLLYQKIDNFLGNMNSLAKSEILDLSKEYSKDRKNKEETGDFLNLLLLVARNKKYWRAVEMINQTKNQIQRRLNRQLALDCLLFRMESQCR